MSTHIQTADCHITCPNCVSWSHMLLSQVWRHFFSSKNYYKYKERKKRVRLTPSIEHLSSIKLITIKCTLFVIKNRHNYKMFYCVSTLLFHQLCLKVTLIGTTVHGTADSALVHGIHDEFIMLTKSMICQTI